MKGFHPGGQGGQESLLAPQGLASVVFPVLVVFGGGPAGKENAEITIISENLNTFSSLLLL